MVAAGLQFAGRVSVDRLRASISSIPQTTWMWSYLLWGVNKLGFCESQPLCPRDSLFHLDLKPERQVVSHLLPV